MPFPQACILFKLYKEHNFLQGRPNPSGQLDGLLEQWFSVFFSLRTTVTSKRFMRTSSYWKY
jgi:hypothetical protein